MTDQEILESCKEEIDQGIKTILEKFSIDDDTSIYAFIENYKRDFISGFKIGYAKATQLKDSQTPDIAEAMPVIDKTNDLGIENIIS